ncbi:hypothetical protein CTI12_AA051170 [Artemisia annua]|uniref:Uncharacterized protein n=1 Tax=Artemisia annua TaxID=35608 RepID=A0A2U1QBB3_ARTAN|nr:hypothetical protein CTI12_AA051170 [Artemisia annua]
MVQQLGVMDHVVSSVGKKKTEKDVVITEKVVENSNTGETQVKGKTSGSMEMDECMQQKSSEQSKEGCVNEKDKGNGVNMQDVNGGKAVNKESSGSKDSVDVNVPGQMFDKKLLVIPTEIDANGTEIVVFDDVLINEGSKKWDKTLYGYFVGKTCLKEGLEFVANNGPWMVKNKPLTVQKWDISLCMDKQDMVRLPVWIKMCGIPIEAWKIKGISALESRVGKPLVMDNETARKCQMGVGRMGFARVLVEMSATKEIP